MIRLLTNSDANTILDIYRQGLDTGAASFETEPPDWPTWCTKYHDFCRFGCERGNTLVGWAALAPVSSRLCYRGVAEVSVYVATQARGNGVGSQLMAALIEASERAGIWTLYSSLFPENQATLKLHQRYGFRIVGVRERIAQLDNRWRDTMILERRSAIVGV